MVVPICKCHHFYIALKKQTNFDIFLNWKSATTGQSGTKYYRYSWKIVNLIINIVDDNLKLQKLPILTNGINRWYHLKGYGNAGNTDLNRQRIRHSTTSCRECNAQRNCAAPWDFRINRQTSHTKHFAKIWSYERERCIRSAKWAFICVRQGRVGR